MADISEQQTTISPRGDEAWADEHELPAAGRDRRLLVKHVEGPLFFGFARGFSEIAPGAREGRLLVLRMERVSYMDQSGAYALQDTIVDLKSASLRVLVVGLPLAPLQILKALHLVREVVPEEDLFPNFPALKAALGRVLTEVEGAEVRPA